MNGVGTIPAGPPPPPITAAAPLLLLCCCCCCWKRFDAELWYAATAAAAALLLLLATGWDIALMGRMAMPAEKCCCCGCCCPGNMAGVGERGDRPACSAKMKGQKRSTVILANES